MLNKKKDAAALFSNDYKVFLWKTLRISLRYPSMMLFVLRMIRMQKKSAKIRQNLMDSGIRIPPFVIASVTKRCNLHCSGCYHRTFHRTHEVEMDSDTLKAIFREAGELGVSIILIVGGEPLQRPDILEILGEFPDIVFPLFTNGTLIDGSTAGRIRTRKNVIPVISAEGLEADTDFRRGSGVYEKIRDAMDTLHRRGIFFGTSLTVTRKNFAAVLSEDFVTELIAAGCRLFFFIDYVPVQDGTEDLVLSNEQVAGETRILTSLRRRLPGLFVAFPGDEEYYGGCLAAGRGFVHISPEGNLEPCPFSPYSDSNLKNVSLREALESQLLGTIRENHHRLRETKGGCALWENREWVASLQKPDTS